MANRETYPASQSPLKGDVSGPAGATLVTVVGLLGIPITPSAPVQGNTLVYNSVTNTWVLGGANSNNTSILINGVGYSDDYDIACNLVLGISNSPTLVNGA
jgi:hypothetical protein